MVPDFSKQLPDSIYRVYPTADIQITWHIYLKTYFDFPFTYENTA